MTVMTRIGKLLGGLRRGLVMDELGAWAATDSLPTPRRAPDDLIDMTTDRRPTAATHRLLAG